jgi:Fe-S oxidoreductase
MFVRVVLDCLVVDLGANLDRVEQMNEELPIWIMEPDPTEKWHSWTEKFTQPRQKAELISEWTSIDDIKRRLKEVRQYARDNNAALVEQLKASLSEKYPQVAISSAPDSAAALSYIAGISDGIKTISINNSRSVTQELKPGLVANGFTVIESYYDEFEFRDKARKSVEYWELPQAVDNEHKGTFDVSVKMSGVDSPAAAGTKSYLAVLGVNAVSAEDGTVFFLQHFRNIYNDVSQAKKVVLVVGLDKIVKDREAAAFQAKCMGMFGAETVILGVQPKPAKTATIAELPFLPGNGDRELHLIILDNKRTGLLQSQFKDFFLCIGCRTCTGACPAYLSGKPLSPKELILNVKGHLSEVGFEQLMQESGTETPQTGADEGRGDAVITEEEIWACTTCRACQQACPLQLKHTDAIVGLRQNLTLVQSKMPETIQLMLRNMDSRGHPWAGVQSLRLRGDWTSETDVKVISEDNAGSVDVLFWVGCTGALVDRNIATTFAVVSLLKKAGVNFGVLGGAENCCGDPARRAGYEFQFQMMAEQNIELFKRHGVKKVVTACPHCFNTLKNEYPQFGGECEIIHHTQLIGELQKEKRLGLYEDKGGTVTYHDPCYLGRHNDIYEPARQILSRIPDTTLVEMEQNRQRSFCCGGGGSRLWLEERIGKKINEMRTDRALQTKAETMVTACPYCLQMFEDVVKAKGDAVSLKVMDIAEVLDRSLAK